MEEDASEIIKLKLLLGETFEPAHEFAPRKSRLPALTMHLERVGEGRHFFLAANSFAPMEAATGVIKSFARRQNRGWVYVHSQFAVELLNQCGFAR